MGSQPVSDQQKDFNPWDYVRDESPRIPVIYKILAAISTASIAVIVYASYSVI
jgi:hypothetical protein